jgi:subtilase family serine protease/RNA polymerase subunit RPABC4/transcription elongation factor Spt4
MFDRCPASTFHGGRSMKKRLFSRLMMRLVSFLIVGTMIFGSMVGIVDIGKAPVIIDIYGDIDITPPGATWQDAIYRVDGNVTILNNARLDIINGGLVFLQDITHVHHLTINGPNGELHLTNSTVSTWLDQINSYPKLNMHVYGRLLMDTNSQLKFPGTLTAYPNSFIDMRDSAITGFPREELVPYVGGSEDEYDDAPVMNFQSSIVDLYDSRIEKIYENTASPGPDFRYNITLEGNARMTIVNSYVGVDFSNDNTRHNVILADDTSIVYIYNMTIDETQEPQASQRSPCLQPYGNIIFGSDTALPYTIHPTKDTTTNPQNEIFLHTDDNVRYVVMPGERMYVDSFDLELPYIMTSATLGVTYSTDPGYNGSRSVQWGLEGWATLQDTIITPIDTSGVGNEITETFDIFAAGMDTFNELRFLDIAFYNDAPSATSVYFDRLWIDVQYFVIDSEAIFYIHRWLVPTVRDENGSPVEGANVTVEFLANGSAPQYPDNGWGNDPNAKILSYLGKTLANYKTTGPDGRAWIPLLAEWMNSTLEAPTFPNTEFIGNYMATASYGIYSNFGTMSFNPFPAMTESDNTYFLNIYLYGLVLPKPDLTPTSIWTDPAIIHDDDNVTIYATIENVGLWPAIDIWVHFMLGVEKLGFCLIRFLNISDSFVCSSVWYGATTGTHVVIVDVDPPVDTGGNITESNEGNNRLSVPLFVEPVLPDLVVFVSAPPQGYPGNPLMITATFQNLGNASVTDKFNVEFFINDNTLDVVSYSQVLPKDGQDFVEAEWTPSEVGNYTIRVVVDSTDAIEEISEDNNEATWGIEVVPVPNLVVVADYISPDDPCPSEGQTIQANAWISNLGQAQAGVFEVAFVIDGVSAGTWTSPGPLEAGGTILATSPGSAITGSPGFGTITVTVDPTDVIRESNNDDNTATSAYTIYTGSQTIWNMNMTLDSVDVSPTDNLVITGDIVIKYADLTITQSGPGIGRHYVKIQDDGSLTLINSVLKSNFDNNWPLNVCVLDNGVFTATDNSEVLLDSPDHGKGVLYSRGNGRVDFMDTMVDGDVRSTGLDVSLKGVDLVGEVVFIYAQTTSYIWDTVFWTVETLSLYSDDGNVNTVDFDIRNVSLADPVLDQQLIFGGDQWIWLTDVETYIPPGEDWWTNMIVGNAKVSVFYWLTVQLVDGAGAPVQQSNLTLWELDPSSLTWSIALDDLGIPIVGRTLSEGIYIHRALSQVRFVIDDTGPWTYRANGSKFVPTEGRNYYPDANVSESVMYNTTIELRFSDLTPEFWIYAIAFIGGNGESFDQPYNWPLNITASVHNDGKIRKTVNTYFYSTDVDPDGDGVMQNDPSTFEDFFIGNASVEIGGNRTENATVTWWLGDPIMIVGANKVSVIVDMYEVITEVNEFNNINLTIVNMFRWPDLDVKPEDITTDPIEVPVNSAVTLEAKITNLGSERATNLRVEFLDDGVSIGNDTLPIVQSSESAFATVTWTPTVPGAHDVRVVAHSANDTVDNTDYNWENNDATITKTVLSLPDLMVNTTSFIGLGSPPNVTEDRGFSFTVRVYNLGESSVPSFSIAAYMVSTSNTTIADLSDLVIGGQAQADFVLVVAEGTLQDTGTYDLIVVVDSETEVTETDENNNEASILLQVVPPDGFVTISEPIENKEVAPGDRPVVSGSVQTNARDPIPGLEVYVHLLQNGLEVPGSRQYQITSPTGIFYFTSFRIPSDIADGTYTIEVTTNLTSIREDTVDINVVEPVDWWNIVFLGLPVWLWLIIIIIIVAIIVGVTLYLYYVGLGKLVECGNCGAFIPEASERCPKCGVEFEKDLAKCSSCGAWIPIGVKVCPECGVEFATGELEMEEYREKMRMQYDQVVAKFRAEADRALGRTLTENEFREWWKTQPTFVTFEEWLREEEEMRKMGSRPCPSCGTLNSVTAKVCHKCGTLFEEEEPPPMEEPPTAKPPEAAPPAGERPPVEKKAVPEERMERIERPVPKKVVKKPVERPVVQKKVIKKPVLEEEEEEF